MSQMRVWSGVLAVMVLCAGSSRAADLSETVKGETIYVKDFDMSSAKFKGDGKEKTEKQDEFKKIAPAVITSNLISYLKEKGCKAEAFKDGLPANALVVSGKTVLVDFGSKAARIGVGFGAGKAKVVADVSVARGSESLASFDGHGSSGAWGGAVGASDFSAHIAKEMAEDIGQALLEKKRLEDRIKDKKKREKEG